MRDVRRRKLTDFDYKVLTLLEQRIVEFAGYYVHEQTRKNLQVLRREVDRRNGILQGARTAAEVLGELPGDGPTSFIPIPSIEQAQGES